MIAGNKCDIKIKFNDSLLLLPASLEKLGKAFGGALKGDFDHTRSSKCTSYQDFEAIRTELLEYNKLDCLVLYQVLTVFGKLIFELFSVCLADIPTISSLALIIYKTKFMDKNAQIPITDTKLYQKISSGYTGGSVDVFVPRNKPGDLVYCYDINSLYPAVMNLYEYPIGTPKFVQGHVDLMDPATFGFLRVKVTSPKDLQLPLLQTKIDGRTVSPLGTWTGWYFSEELKLALTLGYKIEVLEAVLFERGKIFKKYVETLYDLRKTFGSEDPRNMICKLLLNSLYGKFGMDPHLEKWRLVDKDSLLTRGKLPNDVIELGDKILISEPDTKNVVVKPSVTKEEANILLAKREGVELDVLLTRLTTDKILLKERNSLIKNSQNLDISLPIAAAVTAYARIQIYKFKDYIVKNGGTLYYTDTDSIHASMPLPEEMVSGALGQMKLEYITCSAVYLAPKVYGVELFRVEDLIKYKDDLIEGKYLIKIKALKEGHGVTYSDLKELLVKNSKPLPVRQNKLFKKLSMATFISKDLDIQITLTENKRKCDIDKDPGRH